MHVFLVGVSVVVACAVILAAYSVYMLWRDRFGNDARAFSKRIDVIGKGKAATSGDVSILKADVHGEHLAAPRTGMLADIAWSLRNAGLGWSLGTLGTYTAIGAFAGAAIGGLFGFPLGICGALLCIGGALPYGLVRNRSGKRTARLEKQLPDVLDMMASMLRAGHTLPTTLSLLSEQLTAPLGEEFGILHDEITYGGSTEDAMNHLVERTRSEDVRFFVMAILVQRETGGNLSNVLTDLAGVIRERLKLYGKVRSLSAEGRASAWILTSLPLVVGFFINFVDPEYFTIFWVDPTGIKLFYAMVVMLALGNLWMRKLVRIRV